MMKTESLKSDRLSLIELSQDHAPFMFYLLNSPKWKEFIGDRSIRSVDDAATYIQRIIDTPNTNYWVIRHNEDQKLTGIISFMKRDYLDHFDLGFALIPDFFGKGIAFEASKLVLQQAINDKKHEKIQAATLAHNTHSIGLLKKLGFTFQQELERNSEMLHIYSIESIV